MNCSVSRAQRLAALVLTLALLAALPACARKDDAFVLPYRDFEAPPVAERTFEPPSAYPDEGNLGDYHVKIKEARQCEITYLPDPFPTRNAVLVTIDFTNNSRSPISFEDALFDDAFQNGVETTPYYEEGFPYMEKTIVLDRTYDLMLPRQEVQPGETLEVCRLYMASKENPLEVFVSEHSLFDEQKIAKTLVINDAYPEMKPYDAESNLGDYYVDIDTYMFYQFQNKAGEEVFSIPITFVNFSSVPISFSDVMDVHAYQNGEELDFYEDYSSYFGMDFYVKDRGHGFLDLYFKLHNTTDPVTITVSLKSDPSIFLSETTKKLDFQYK